MSLRGWWLACSVLVLCPWVTGCGAGGQTGSLNAIGPGSDGTGTATMSEWERAQAERVVARVNEERVKRSLAPLDWSEGCATAAYLHAVDMDVRDYFDHIDPDGNTPGQRMSDQGIDWYAAGENIAYGYSSADDVMDGWMGSSDHEANILEPEFNVLGVGVHVAGNGVVYWVQDFAGIR